MSKNNKGHAITLGGITLEREGGGSTVAMPVVRYAGLSDEHVAEFWDYLVENPTLQDAFTEFQQKVAAELIEWGRKRNLRRT